MALIIEDGSGRSDAESYVSLADCDAYHSARANSSWTGDEAAKEAALLEATAFVEDSYRGLWRGVRSKWEQALSWPRFGVIDQDGFQVASDSLPSLLQAAVCEAALRAIEGDLTPDLDRGGQIKRQKVDVIETEYKEDAPPGKVYPEIENKIACLLVNSHLIPTARG